MIIINKQEAYAGNRENVKMAAEWLNTTPEKLLAHLKKELPEGGICHVRGIQFISEATTTTDAEFILDELEREEETRSQWQAIEDAFCDRAEIDPVYGERKSDTQKDNGEIDFREWKEHHWNMWCSVDGQEELHFYRSLPEYKPKQIAYKQFVRRKLEEAYGYRFIAPYVNLDHVETPATKTLYRKAKRLGKYKRRHAQYHAYKKSTGAESFKRNFKDTSLKTFQVCW